MEKKFIKLITERKSKLENIKILLKKKFIGIDYVIDKIIDSISLWYLTPDIQFKPLIVSLWGITGVGKTDLVRTLVNELGFTDKFIEIQMDNQDGYIKTIENHLDDSDIDSTEPAILLLDEIQRYRTINESGAMIKNKYFNDVWMLLSDGRFQNNSNRKRELVEMFLDEMYWQDQRDNGEEESDNGEEKKLTNDVVEDSNVPRITKPKKDKLKYKTSYWAANRLRKKIDLDIDIEDIMKMSINERMDLIKEGLKSTNVNEGKSYEKLLIFISGNLDSAFKMADDIENSESDADIMHELSKRVNVIHIKKALSLQFKPEQIARFGNNHIIYPCLDKKAYQQIIKINSQEILDRIKKKHDINIELSQDIYDIMYNNGVYPTQGVRPAISTVFNLLGSNLPHFIYESLISNVKSFKLSFVKGRLLSIINGKTISRKVVLELDNIRMNKSIDEKMLVMVHEIGHALIYSILFNTPPKQINVNSSGFSSGFILNHESIDNKTFIKNKISVLFGGIVAEEIVFGEEYKSTGASGDIVMATDLAGDYVRSYGMDGTLSYIRSEQFKSNSQMNHDIDKTNNIIENLLVEQKKITRDLLNNKIILYKKILDNVIKFGKISPETFLKICNENGLKLVQKEINDRLSYSYDEKLKKFLQDVNSKM